MRYFTADPHFGHGNIIDYCDRPFTSVEAMDQSIANAYRHECTHDDTLWILGDITGANNDIDAARAALAQIRADVHWIRGNHDVDPSHLSDLATFEGDRVAVATDLRNDDGYVLMLVLDHYPLLAWNGHHYGHMHLHGHIHSSQSPLNKRRMDVGVDAQAFLPVAEDDITERLSIIPAPVDYEG